MRRLVMTVLLAAVALAATACPATPPPPPLYRPPVIDSVVATPDPVAPGDEVVVVLEVHDDEVVSGVQLGDVRTPAGIVVPGGIGCTAEPVQGAGTTEATITLRCPVPAYATDGIWRVALRVLDDAGGDYAYQGLQTSATFEVAGGAPAASPPRLLDYDISPSLVDQVTTFALTMRVAVSAPLAVAPPYTNAQDSGNFRFVKIGATQSFFACFDTVVTPVSAGEVEVTATCSPGVYNTWGRAEVGLHRTGVPVRDALGTVATLVMEVFVYAEQGG